MTFKIALLASCILLPFSGVLTGALAASGSSGGATTVGGYSPRILPSPDAAKSAGPAPTAVPGSHASDSPVADPTKAIADMNPNEQLFDAINRGDAQIAQDAIKHGADLSARNVLGMSPLELSVDLDRDKITFMLLALQGSDGGSHRAAPARTAGKPAAVKNVFETAAAPATPRVVTRVSAPAPTASPVRQYANDAGTPNPQAGFLGFGPH